MEHAKGENRGDRGGYRDRGYGGGRGYEDRGYGGGGGGYRSGGRGGRGGGGGGGGGRDRYVLCIYYSVWYVYTYR